MFFKKVKKADLEAVSSRNADQERQENKMMRAWISFGVVIILLILDILSMQKNFSTVWIQILCH